MILSLSVCVCVCVCVREWVRVCGWVCHFVFSVLDFEPGEERKEGEGRNAYPNNLIGSWIQYPQFLVLEAQIIIFPKINRKSNK